MITFCRSIFVNVIINTMLNRHIKFYFPFKHCQHGDLLRGSYPKRKRPCELPFSSFNDYRGKNTAKITETNIFVIILYE